MTVRIPLLGYSYLFRFLVLSVNPRLQTFEQSLDALLVHPRMFALLKFTEYEANLDVLND